MNGGNTVTKIKFDELRKFLDNFLKLLYSLISSVESQDISQLPSLTMGRLLITKERSMITSRAPPLSYWPFRLFPSALA